MIIHDVFSLPISNPIFSQIGKPLTRGWTQSGIGCGWCPHWDVNTGCMVNLSGVKGDGMSFWLCQGLIGQENCREVSWKGSSIKYWALNIADCHLEIQSRIVGIQQSCIGIELRMCSQSCWCSSSRSGWKLGCAKQGQVQGEWRCLGGNPCLERKGEMPLEPQEFVVCTQLMVGVWTSWYC